MKDREFLLWMFQKLDAAGLFNPHTRARLKKIAEKTSPRKDTQVPYEEPDRVKWNNLHGWK